MPLALIVFCSVAPSLPYSIGINSVRTSALMFVLSSLSDRLPSVLLSVLVSVLLYSSICLFVRHLPSSYIWMCLSILLSVRSSVLLSVYVSVHLSVYICPSISSCISVHLSFYISSFAHGSIPPSMRSTAFLAEHLSDV